jgi:hypothetical protein
MVYVCATAMHSSIRIIARYHLALGFRFGFRLLRHGGSWRLLQGFPNHANVPKKDYRYAYAEYRSSEAGPSRSPESG